MTIEQAVHRLTGELADWYRIDAGHLRVGDRADVVIIDPERLDESLDEYAEERVEQYGGLSRMVNRNDDTVSAVFVGGHAVFIDGNATDLVGRQRTGRFLLRFGLEPLASYENFTGLIVVNGVDAMYEHHEEWHWRTGESAILRFVTVHRVENGKITVWKDYWDMGGLTNTAPPDWLEEVVASYSVPVFDATGLI